MGGVKRKGRGTRGGGGDSGVKGAEGEKVRGSVGECKRGGEGGGEGEGRGGGKRWEGRTDTWANKLKGR